MFEVTILGCAGAVPTVARGLPSIAVRRDGDVFLFDCGEGTQRQMMRFGLSCMKVRAIFITHLHVDHFLGVFGLVETMGLSGRTEKLSLYGPRGSKAVFGKKPFLEVVEIGADFSADFGEFSVSAFSAKHSGEAFGFAAGEKEKRRFYEQKAKALGVRGPMFSELSRNGSIRVGGKTIRLRDVTYVQPGKKIAYSGDSAPCRELVRAAKGADLLIHDSTFGEDRVEEAAEAMHSTALQAATMAKKAGAKKLLLTHFSGRYPDASALVAEAKKAFAETIAAFDGLKLEV